MTIRQINGSVGAGGVNEPDDVFTVQALLNHVDAASGGPVSPLEVDGLVGPLTISAINSFQVKQFNFQDGLVEPGRLTFSALRGFFRAPDEFGEDLFAGPGAPAIHRFVCRDTRLQGTKPAGDSVLEVDANTPLAFFILTGGDTALHNADPVRLKLMAHGAPGHVQVCKEGLGLDNLASLSVLRDRFRAGVDLFSCSVAFIAPGKGDGNVFCSRMAQTLNTSVRASTATQFYTLHTAGSGLDFGQWEGTVLTYGPKGDVINVEHEPKF
ncbi:hypothetical protein [Knoellia aerolata]|uniref:hypothetical protein n=1 Tax=Knoellia aerolata TaxID=442954 RepID=UPI0012ECEAC3|nr:hypothetical protein [Knoellia aerolata]